MYCFKALCFKFALVNVSLLDTHDEFVCLEYIFLHPEETIGFIYFPLNTENTKCYFSHNFCIIDETKNVSSAHNKEWL